MACLEVSKRMKAQLLLPAKVFEEAIGTFTIGAAPGKCGGARGSGVWLKSKAAVGVRSYLISAYLHLAS
jgi:hypothetical protein